MTPAFLRFLRNPISLTTVHRYYNVLEMLCALGRCEFDYVQRTIMDTYQFMAIFDALLEHFNYYRILASC